MNINLFSLIVGGVLWELCSAYLHFVLKPRLRRFKITRKGLAPSNFREAGSSEYGTPSIGFNNKLKNN